MARKDDPQETQRAEEAQEESMFRLDQEIARKYDPQTLSRLIVRDAGRGEPLDLHTRSRMEHTLGGDFSNVRIIRGPLAEEITNRYRADAVTVGGTELILVREGWQSNFQSAEGFALLAHELTHVQQNQAGLHFEHSGGDDSSSPHEQAAYARQRQVLARERGGQLRQDTRQNALGAERRIWDQVKKTVKKKKKKEEQKQEIRGGSANLQGQSD
jgi:hypothetical protein